MEENAESINIELKSLKGAYDMRFESSNKLEKEMKRQLHDKEAEISNNAEEICNLEEKLHQKDRELESALNSTANDHIHKEVMLIMHCIDHHSHAPSLLLSTPGVHKNHERDSLLTRKTQEVIMRNIKAGGDINGICLV